MAEDVVAVDVVPAEAVKRPAALWARLLSVAIVMVIATAFLTLIGMAVGFVAYGRAGVMAMLNIAPWLWAVAFVTVVVRRVIPEVWREWRGKKRGERS